ncbi:MAG: TerD family protein, partial [Magnetococcales bacterium]|nr:TerD family protein [Magnetococcales bacterium]
KLANLPVDITRVALVVSIHEAQRRWLTFGKVGDAYFRIVDGAKELFRAPVASGPNQMATAIVVGELSRSGSTWIYQDLQRGTSGGLKEIALGYGVDV